MYNSLGMDGLSTLLMQVFGVGGFEWIFIILIIVVFIFGVKKIPELAKSFGKASAEFEKARIEAKRELRQIRNQDTNVSREKLEAIADTLGIDYTNKNDDELRIAIDVEIDKSKNKL
ncbi:MAG TPA: twin-arginine translocase TatA/TatE family subunit [Nitrososphaeraceae archaeon]|jgi:sec-independent protein translocase protein TatA|nr:twin-arginine translocase TatA/TatE family subunit [Nitrososphaeraceae archaeon]